MDGSRWNEFSRRFADAIFAEFPDWRTTGTLSDANDDGSTWSLKVPSPQHDDDTFPLHILTEDDEITVSFDYYRTHFGDGAGEEETTFRNALAFIRDIVAERVSVVSWWSGDRWNGSCTADAGEVPAA